MTGFFFDENLPAVSDLPVKLPIVHASRLGARMTKVVHLRVGNMRRREFETWLKRCWPRIEAAVKEHKLVNVFPTSIQSVR